MLMQQLVFYIKTSKSYGRELMKSGVEERSSYIAGLNAVSRELGGRALVADLELEVVFMGDSGKQTASIIVISLAVEGVVSGTIII
jgi:hypothetical protein